MRRSKSRLKFAALALLLAKIFSTASKTKLLSSLSAFRRAALNAAFKVAFEICGVGSLARQNIFHSLEDQTFIEFVGF